MLDVDQFMCSFRRRSHLGLYVLVHLFACFVRVYGYDRVASLWRRVPIPRILDDRVLCGKRRIASFTWWKANYM